MKLFKNGNYFSSRSRDYSWKEGKYFRYFKHGIWVLAILLMICSLFRKPDLYEKPGSKMTFAPDVKSDMKKYSLSVPLYSKPDKGSEILKSYTNVDEYFIFLERFKGQWIRVVDQDGDTGWISSYLLRFVPGR
uniref:SH3 domain-containing protein n=1 Tax=candidate division WOR-3 bacterium TaxID=2052148 RepID=A0A7V3ZXP9_UNCW3